MKNSLASYSPDMASVTVVSSNSGPLAKIFYWKDEELKSHAKASIFTGSARTVFAETPVELKIVIDNLGSNEALALGRLYRPNFSCPLTTQGRPREGAISRTKEFFKHSEGTGCLLLDVDTKDIPARIIEKLGGRSVIDVIHEVVPELNECARLIRASSSGGIVKPDGSMKPATGFHVFVWVKDQTQSKQLLQLMHDRFWEAGYGFYKISKSGSLLERSLIDMAVDGAERLVFEAAPILRPPLERKIIPTQVFEGSVLGSIKLPDSDKVKELKKQARAILKPASAKQTKRYTDDQCKRIVARTSIPKSVARKVIRQRLKGFELSENDILEIARSEYSKVSDFLDQTNVSRGLPCPIEGSDYGLSTAYFYPSDSYRPYPRIISFAHGIITEFTFERFRSHRGLQWLPNDFIGRR